MRNTPTMMPPHPANAPWGGNPYNDYLSHSAGQRIQTTGIEVKAIRAKYPDRYLTILTPGLFINGTVVTCDLLSFASSGQATATSNLEASEAIIEYAFVPPVRRHGGEEGSSVEDVRFAAYDYEYQGTTYLLYYFHASESTYLTYKAQFLLSPPGSASAGQDAHEKAIALIAAATQWGQESHEEAWVFDRGFWAKDKEFYKSIHKSSWDDVILDEEKKQAMIDDAEGFFSSEESYKEFSVPWKRGLIFYGPPGNGKTISIKALMNSLSKRTNPTVDLLYVKSFNSFQGPEYGILAVFNKARQMAPCVLIFEDIDSLVNPGVRSYFLNAVDGLESNNGILMIGSTNHLERLDPGIAKRPSRFDRKYFFDMPVRDERVQYAHYWRRKLADNKKIDFPEVLCGMIADITDAFSFAYMKEAFVAALLAIVVSRDSTPSLPIRAAPLRSYQSHTFSEMAAAQRRFRIGLNALGEGGSGGGDGGEDERKKAEKTLLWKEIKKQVDILRREMDSDSSSNSDTNTNTNTNTITNNRDDNVMQELPVTNSRAVSFGQSLHYTDDAGTTGARFFPPASNYHYPATSSGFYGL